MMFLAGLRIYHSGYKKTVVFTVLCYVAFLK